MKSKKKRLLFVFGTRPEALKMAPVILEAKRRKNFHTIVCLTAQHRHMVDQVLDLFKIPVDFDLDIMEKGQTLGGLTQRLFPQIREVFIKTRPDLVLMQGDTTTAFATALQAFYEHIPVAHIEAGLRSHQKYYPFPEEINRVLISRLADYHFAPTPAARRNLLREGVDEAKIFVSGNTVVDALIIAKKWLMRHKILVAGKGEHSKKIILVTAHRRENFGKPLQMICRALKDLIIRHRDIEIVYPVHLNPNVQKVVLKELRGISGIRLLPPLGYQEFLRWMQASYLILTDSGGIQEEAPSFGKPVLILRDVSERNEGIDLKVAKLVGTSREKIVREASRLLQDPQAYARMVKRKNPYGDGTASEKILNQIYEIIA